MWDVVGLWYLSLLPAALSKSPAVLRTGLRTSGRYRNISVEESTLGLRTKESYIHVHTYKHVPKAVIYTHTKIQTQIHTVKHSKHTYTYIHMHTPICRLSLTLSYIYTHSHIHCLTHTLSLTTHSLTHSHTHRHRTHCRSGLVRTVNLVEEIAACVCRTQLNPLLYDLDLLTQHKVGTKMVTLCPGYPASAGTGGTHPRARAPRFTEIVRMRAQVASFRAASSLESTRLV